MNNHLLGQGIKLHWTIFFDCPWHGFPPKLGGGLMHCLVSIFWPCPNEAEHSPECHSVHLPSTADKTSKVIRGFSD